MLILLGCGHKFIPGWTHVDRVQSGHVDVVHDLDIVPWPFNDNVAEKVEAIDVLEHLSNVVVFMNECWRILRPNGVLVVQAVGWQSENLWRDPTHKRGFHEDTFRYFDPDSEWYRAYGDLYTPYVWKVHESWMIGGNVIARMEPRK